MDVFDLFPVLLGYTVDELSQAMGRDIKQARILESNLTEFEFTHRFLHVPEHNMDEAFTVTTSQWLDFEQITLESGMVAHVFDGDVTGLLLLKQPGGKALYNTKLSNRASKLAYDLESALHKSDKNALAVVIEPYSIADDSVVYRVYLSSNMKARQTMDAIEPVLESHSCVPKLLFGSSNTYLVAGKHPVWFEQSVRDEIARLPLNPSARRIVYPAGFCFDMHFK